MERETETQEPQNEPAFEELKNVESVQIVIQFSELDNEQKKRLLKVLQKL